MSEGHPLLLIQYLAFDFWVYFCGFKTGTLGKKLGWENQNQDFLLGTIYSCLLSMNDTWVHGLRIRGRVSPDLTLTGTNFFLWT